MITDFETVFFPGLNGEIERERERDCSIVIISKFSNCFFFLFLGCKRRGLFIPFTWMIMTGAVKAEIVGSRISGRQGFPLLYVMARIGTLKLAAACCCS